MPTDRLTPLADAATPLGPGDAEWVESERAARTRALDLERLTVESETLARRAALTYLSELVGALAPLRPLTAEDADGLARALARATADSEEDARLELLLGSFDALTGADIAPSAAQLGILRLLVSLGRVEEASLWISTPRAGVQCVAYVGAAGATRRMRAAAREILSGGPERGNERGSVHGTPVRRGQATLGAIVLRARPTDRKRALALAQEAAGAVAPALERGVLLEQNAVREQALTAASERRLTRLGFDIHDGPIQDVTALAGDLRLFGRQLQRVLPPDGPCELLLGRLEDFDARLVALDRELRELAHSLERTSVLERPFADVLRQTMAAFTTRNGIALSLDLRGDPSGLSASQRLALLSVVRESLVNVRDHSGARKAAISIAVGRSHTHATVTDAGRGFDVEKTLVRAARRGRLGLIGMSERVRLLGGRLDIDSRPGGPTRVSVVVPRWDGLAAEPRRHEAA